MKALQYMYASWMNSPNRGFCKYSETPGITPEEATTIEKMMKYVARPGVPRGYTDDELLLHPINNSFFKLPSGRYCLAQSAYVGREDRGFAGTGRFGNYLLHAYVFDELGDFVPMSHVGDSIFRRDLTTEEWQATNPPPLPEVDIPAVGKLLSQAEVNDFFDARRTELLAQLVEAMIAARAGDKTVYFNDEHTNMKYWYKALAICLPLSYAGRLAFNTYSFSTQTLPTNVDPASRLSVVNTATSLEPQIPSPSINVQGEAAKGNFVIDLVRNVYTPVTPGTYARTIVEMFKRGTFEALTYAKKIDGVLTKYGCSIERSIDVLAFAEGRLEHFPTIDAVLGVMSEIGSAADPAMAASVRLIAERIVAGAYPFNQSLAEVIKKTVYPSVDNELKYKLIDFVFKGALANAYGTTPEAYAESINRLMPCEAVVTAAYLYNSGKVAGFMTERNPDRIYFLLSHTLSCYDALEPKYGDAVKAVLKDCISGYVKRADIASLDTIYRISAARVGAYARAAFMSVVNTDSVSGYPTDTFFILLGKLQLEVNDLVTAMHGAIRAWGTDDSFIGRYTAFAQANPQLESYLRSMPDCVGFFEKLDAQRFERERADLPALMKYLELMYPKAADSRIFENKLRQYLSTLNWQGRIRDCLTIYNTYFKDKTTLTLTDKDRGVIYTVYNNVVAEAPKRDFVASLKDNADFKAGIEGFLHAYVGQGFAVDDNYKVIRALYSVTAQPAAARIEKAKKFELLSAITTPTQVAIFNKELFGVYVDIILDAIKETRADATVAVSALIPLSFDEAGYKHQLLKLLASPEKEAKRAKEQLPAAMLLFFVGRDKNEDTVFEVFEEYLKSIEAKDRINIYKNATKLTQDKALRDKALKYITDFNAKNKVGFFAKFFGKK